jgi:hypothetical protein
MRTSKLTLLLFTALLGSSVMAQSIIDTQPAVSPILTISTDDVIVHENNTPTPMRGASLFAETFSAGFAGDNGVGPWVAFDSSPAGNQIWKIGGNGGQVPVNFTFASPSLVPQFTTSANGYAFFDAYRFNQPTLPTYESVLGTLTSPSLDLSASPSVILEYKQNFAYCCFSFSPLTVEVSNDGGTTWVVFPGEGSFLPDANTSSGNLTTIIDISCVAAFQSDVLVRFAYNNAFDQFFGFYSWCIDDIFLYEAPSDNDIEVIQVTNGDVFNDWEYRVTPLSQARYAADGGLMVGVMYSNKGSEDQTNAVISIDVLDNGGSSIFNYMSPAFDIPSNGNAITCPHLSDTMYIDTGFEPSAIGDYTIRVNITSDQVDASPLNNTMDKSIEYTQFVYGHDNESMLTLEYRPDAGATAGTFDKFGLGNIFTVPNEGSEANGVIVRFGPNTDVEWEVEVRIYETDDLGSINPVADAGPGNAGAFYEIQIADVPSTIAGSVETWIEFEDPIDLLPGMFYFVCVIQDVDNSTSELTILGQPLSDTDNSSRVIALTGNQEFFWFGDQGTPSVRLTLDGEPVVNSLADLTAIDGVTLGQNMPNPAANSTLIQYDLERNLNIAFQVTDAQGRLVFDKKLGTKSVGQHSIELDLTDFAPGVYQYSIISGSSRLTKSMVVGK